MNKTLFRLLLEKYPTVMAAWDRWDYKIRTPLSLDDLALLSVELINKNGFRSEITFGIGQ